MLGRLQDEVRFALALDDFDRRATQLHELQ